MPALAFPQLLLSGLFVAHAEMARWLQWVSDALPLVYAHDALARVAAGGSYGACFAANVAVTIGAGVLALALGAATLRRGRPSRRASTRSARARRASQPRPAH
jgi:ABC-2 type transport system permease protein